MVHAGPHRSCVGCRTTRGIGALVRVTAGGDPVVDGPSKGRGAWLCRTATGIDEGCLDAAMQRRAFDRAWRSSMGNEERRALRDRLAAWRPEG